MIARVLRALGYVSGAGLACLGAYALNFARTQIDQGLSLLFVTLGLGLILLTLLSPRHGV